MKRKILLLLVLGSCVFCLSFPCLAYVTASAFNPREAYLNTVPYSVDFYRTDKRTHYYYGDDNVLADVFTIIDDSNLDYYLNYYGDIEDTPFIWTSYESDVTHAQSLAEYRYSDSAQIYNLTLDCVTGKYNQLLDLRTVPDVFVYTDDVGTFNVIFEIITTLGAYIPFNWTVKIQASEGIAYLVTWNVIYQQLSTYGYEYLLEDSVYLQRLTVTTEGVYNGAGTYRWLGFTDTLSMFPTNALGGSYFFTDRFTVDEALSPVVSVFRGIHNVLSVEILPFITLYRLLGIAVLIPATIKIVRSV